MWVMEWWRWREEDCEFIVNIFYVNFVSREKKIYGGFRVDGEFEKKWWESVEEREKKKLIEIEGKFFCFLVVEEKII